LADKAEAAAAAAEEDARRGLSNDEAASSTTRAAAATGSSGGALRAWRAAARAQASSAADSKRACLTGEEMEMDRKKTERLEELKAQQQECIYLGKRHVRVYQRAAAWMLQAHEPRIKFLISACKNRRKRSSNNNNS